MVKNNQRKNAQDNALNDAFDFIKRNWLMITGLLIAVPYLMRYLKAQAEKSRVAALELALKEKIANVDIVKENKLVENTNPLTQKAKRLKITGSSELWAASTLLAHDFGVKYSDNGHWYDVLNPRGWTENDASIRNTLLKYRNYFSILEKLYYEVDTNSRSLRSDILKDLDKSELVLVKKGLKI